MSIPPKLSYNKLAPSLALTGVWYVGKSAVILWLRDLISDEGDYCWLVFPIHKLQVGNTGKMFRVVSNDNQTIIHSRTANQ